MALLSGTRVLVTGGTSGLGRAMAQALVQAGARVAVTSRDRERAQTTAAELGAGALGVQLDVRNASGLVNSPRAKRAIGTEEDADLARRAWRVISQVVLDRDARSRCRRRSD
ncbi:MAG: SDR family NAD(P)-dependent oxidoreductase [Solirubrobacteraceae bacterium]